MSAFLSKSEWLEMDRVVVVAVKKTMRRWASFYIDRLPRYRDVSTELTRVGPRESRGPAWFRPPAL